MSTNLSAAKKSIRAMRSTGLLEDIDAALIQQVLTLAEAVDADPTNAALEREYGSAFARLRDVGRDAPPVVDPVAAMLAHITAEPDGTETR